MTIKKLAEETSTIALLNGIAELVTSRNMLYQGLAAIQERLKSGVYTKIAMDELLRIADLTLKESEKKGM